ncbi:MAG TPA: hypothetical protein VF234_03415 [Limnochordia bacterium]
MPSNGRAGSRWLVGTAIALLLTVLAALAVAIGVNRPPAPLDEPIELPPGAPADRDGWAARGAEQLAAGDYDGAIEAFAFALASPAPAEGVPGDDTLLRANLGIAYFLKAESLRRDAGAGEAVDWYERAAAQLAAFVDATDAEALRLVGEYYLAAALVHSGRYRQALAVGEDFLAADPGMLTVTGLLPAGAEGSMLELAAFAAWAAAERAWFWQRDDLRRLAVAYAEEAIARFPQIALQAYWISGQEAFRQHRTALAQERIERFVSRLTARGEETLASDDRADLAAARELLRRLEGMEADVTGADATAAPGSPRR